MFNLIDNYNQNSKNHGILFSRYEYAIGKKKYMNHKRKINWEKSTGFQQCALYTELFSLWNLLILFQPQLMLLYDIIFTYVKKKKRLIHTLYFYFSEHWGWVCIFFWVLNQYCCLFCLGHMIQEWGLDVHQRMEDAPGLLLKFLVQSLCLQLELEASLYPFCFPCLISYKREKHTC